MAGDRRQAAAAVSGGAAGAGRPEQRGEGGLPHGTEGRCAGRAGPGVPAASAGPPGAVPGRRTGGGGTEVLVVNGAADPFGVPEAADGIRVVVLPGAVHSLAGQGGAIRRVVASWLGELAGVTGGRPSGAARWGSRRRGAVSPVSIEDHDAVAERRPALLWVTGDGAGRLAVGGVCVRARWRVWARGCPLVSCALVALSLSVAGGAGVAIGPFGRAGSHFL